MNYQRQSGGIWTQIGIASFRTGPASMPNIQCDSAVPYGFTRVRPFLSYIYFITGMPDPDKPTTSAASTSSTSADTTVTTIHAGTNSNSPSTEASDLTATTPPTTTYGSTETTSNEPTTSNANGLKFMLSPISKIKIFLSLFNQHWLLLVTTLLASSLSNTI